MLEKIVSGAQTGADQGALEAARQLGLATGGWMPKGFLTEEGPRLDLAIRYGVQARRSAAYPPRTRANVRESDGTVWVGRQDGRGFQCTMTATQDYGKPVLVLVAPGEGMAQAAESLRQFVEQFNIRVLNVAGPRASRDVQAHGVTWAVIVEAFGVHA